MPEFNFALGLTFVAQTIGSAVMAFLLLRFYSQYGRKNYLLQWALAWLALAVHHFTSGIAAALSLRLLLPEAHPARVANSVVNNVSGYLLVAWLLFGVYELMKRRPVRLLTARRTIIGLVAFGTLSALVMLSPSDPAPARYLARIGLRSLLSAAALAVAAVALWRARKPGEGIGFPVLAGAFTIYALEQLHYLTVAAVYFRSGHFVEYAIYLGYVDFLLQSIIGMGMMACLLENEQEAAELAAVEIEHLAYHDALTGLPNRPLFMDRLIVALSQAHRGSQKLAVLFLDLDRFKNINDSLGHTAGDSLLKAVSDRIRRCVREGDTVARFGGDEFTMLIPRIENIEDAAKIASKIIETIKIPFLLGGQELFISTSIGVSLYPGDGLDPETLVRNADTAMYRAKEQGRDNYQLYAPDMNAQALERLDLENTLRKALSQEELVLFYQPQVSARTGAVIGLEALVRWQHPERGLLSPAQFISAAEVSGLIIPIGDWILRTACRQARVWQKKLDQKITIAVNLSARQFQQPDLVEQVRAALDDTGLDPSTLEIEITESNAMQNAENTIYTLRELKAIGVRISMDDFGTGYSSLNYLKRFPIDTLKLDQSFVRDVTTDPSDAAIVSAVITMAHSLNLKVVAEGVETEEQLQFLRRQNCDVIQGYYFSRPASAPDLEPFLLQSARG